MYFLFPPLLSLSVIPQVLAQLTPSPTYNPPAAASATSPSTAIPNLHWSQVLGNSLWFYDAQRSGQLDQGTYGNRVAWRNDSCLDDGSDWGIDLSGGWYDAGDYIKATFPLGFTMFALSWGALTHGRAYDMANQTAYLDGTLRWGYDWLMKAHPESDVLYAQVGSSDVDDSYWGGDQNIPGPRPAYPVNSSNPGTDIFASTAFAFAMGSMVYTPGVFLNTTSSSSPPTTPSLANATYAASLLRHATQLYAAANNTTPYSTYSDSIPEIGDAYTSSGWGDDLCLAALSLALATNRSSYYREAYTHYRNYSTIPNSQGVWNWDTAVPAIYVLFVEAALARPALAVGAGLDGNLTGWRNQTEVYFDAIVNQNLKSGYLTSGGLLYYPEDSRQASLNPAMAVATLMMRYAPMASSTDKGQSYLKFAQGQIDYLMGKNPMNAVYLVGMHPNSPQNPHSAPASGGNNLTTLRTNPPTNLHVLYGAMVGGPLDSDQYWDYRDDWVENEVALDYNANIPALAAMMLINNASDPYYVQVQAGTYTIPSGQPCDDALPCSGNGGLSKGAIAGIVIGVILGIALIVALICFWKRRQIAAWWRKGYRGRKR